MNKNKVAARATVIVAIGYILFLIAIAGIGFLYFSTILPGMTWSLNWWIRKAIYVVLFSAIHVAYKLIDAGTNCIKAYHAWKRKSGRR